MLTSQDYSVKYLIYAILYGIGSIVRLRISDDNDDLSLFHNDGYYRLLTVCINLNAGVSVSQFISCFIKSLEGVRQTAFTKPMYLKHEQYPSRYNWQTLYITVYY